MKENMLILLAAVADVALLLNIYHWWGCSCGS